MKAQIGYVGLCVWLQLLRRRVLAVLFVWYFLWGHGEGPLACQFFPSEKGLAVFVDEVIPLNGGGRAG